jgi:hypothetical protein
MHLNLTVTEKRQQERSKSEWILQAVGSGRRKATSSADCSVDRRHIHADSASGSTYDLQMGTCRMSQSDQQELLPTRKSAPVTHLPPAAAGEWRRRSACRSPSSSLGPLKKAMAMAPLTQTAVPNILARLLGLLTSTLSSLLLVEGIDQRDGIIFIF